MVGQGGARSLSIVATAAHSRGYGGQQQLSLLDMEDGDPATPLRSPRTDGDRSHYPTGASKWNPVEHRLFSEISKHWAAEPLTSYEKILKFIRTTVTTTGLKVRAFLDRTEYPTKQRVTAAEMAAVALTRHKTLEVELHNRAPICVIILASALS